MDLLLQVSEKELEEFPEPPVDHTDQDKPDRTSTGGTQSSNISHHLQTQTSTASKASKVSMASVSQQPRYRRPATQPAMWPVPSYWRPAMRMAMWLAMWPVPGYWQPVMWPVTLHTFVYRKEQCDQSLAHIPLLLTLQVEPRPEDIFQDPLSRSSEVFAFRNPHR